MGDVSDIKGRICRASVCRQRSAVFGVLLVVAIVLARSAAAQTEAEQAKPGEVRTGGEEYRTFYLTSLTEPNEANELTTDLRNLLPRAHLYYLASEGAISMRGSEDDITLAQKVLGDLDRKRKVYRITYTIRETDGGKPVATQHVSVVVATGGKTNVRQGSRVPIVTGSPDSESMAKSNQVQYLDVGLSIEASIEGSADGLQLRSRVEQSSVSEEKSGIGSQDPVIQQTRLEGTSTLAQGSPLVLGSLDIPGTTRHEEIEVVSEPVG
jgi:type II secretory pathway component GspD/PulD (secretin)